ncbi:MAG: spore coat protein U domain-containing protein [Amylibacter sp.]|nr:spore coat protein U domain-containing protein [Amylibacter sp.]
MKMNFKQNNIKLAIAAGLVIGSAGLTVPAFASSPVQKDMDVTASIAVACSVAIVDVAFGSYDALGANKTTPAKASGSITATCTSGASGKITIDEGANKVATGEVTSTLGAPLRQMKTDQTPGSGQTKFLAYTLHTADNDSTAQWNGTDGVSYVSAGADVVKTVYGFIPQNQVTAMKGSYADQVEVSVTY